MGIALPKFPHVGIDIRAVKDPKDRSLWVQKFIEKYHAAIEAGYKLKVMKGGPMKIQMKADTLVRPLHVCNPRKTPYAFQGAAKDK